MGHFSFGGIRFGTQRNDSLFGGNGNDFLFGFGGNDRLFGNGGNDIIFGGAGDDSIFGGAGNDALGGGRGNDMLQAGLGNDRVYGETGNDYLIGGRGNDVLFGGSGADKFFFNPNRSGEGADRIADFNLAEDKIVLNAADVLASTPGLADADGDPALDVASDLDASDLWNLAASADGDLVVIHPNGTIEIDGLAFSETLSFADILPVIELVTVDPMAI
jgi:Ca2+-binding RTX toxin-like protein